MKACGGTMTTRQFVELERRIIFLFVVTLILLFFLG
jgi:hypothetical protein